MPRRMACARPGLAMSRSTMSMRPLPRSLPTEASSICRRPMFRASFASRCCYFFGVGDIDVAADTVKKGGGSIVHGPAEVPGGIYIIIGTDPQGAEFGLVGPRKS